MIGIGNIIPKPRVELHEEKFRVFTYGMACKIYKNSQWTPACIFQDPHCLFMLNVFDAKEQKLIRRFNYYEIMLVRPSILTLTRPRKVNLCLFWVIRASGAPEPQNCNIQ